MVRSYLFRDGLFYKQLGMKQEGDCFEAACTDTGLVLWQMKQKHSLPAKIAKGRLGFQIALHSCHQTFG